MAVLRYCPHGNLRATCPQCRGDAVSEAQSRAAANRARGESGVVGRIEGAELPYPWQRSALEAWTDGGHTGLVAFSLGLPLGDLLYAVVADVVNASPSSNVLVACAPSEAEEIRATFAQRFGLRPTSLVDHHFLEPRNDGSLVIADLQELETVDVAAWGRFASNGLLVLLDADGVTQGLGAHLVDAQFRHRFCLSRQPSAIDLLWTRPWASAFGPVLYRATEEEARDLGILPRIKYRLHVEMLKPEARGASGFGPEGPWEAADIPTRLPALQAGPFIRSRARDVAIRRAKETPNLLVIHDGVPVPGAQRTVKLADLPDKCDPVPAAWVLANPTADGKAILRLATVAYKTLGQPAQSAVASGNASAGVPALANVGAVEDAVVLPVPVDLCRQPPWSDPWRMAANQLDRVAAGLLLATNVGDAMMAEDLESLVGVALALRGLPAEDLYKLTPVVAEAAHAAHAGQSISPDRVRAAARAAGGLAASLLVAAESGPLHLLRIAHPRFTPVVPDLPHPSLYDARRHAWRGRAFAALANAAKAADLVTAWGRYPELRFVFPSSALLEAATAYCAKHKLKGPLDGENLVAIPDKTTIVRGDRVAAAAVLKEWNDALALAEEHEREFLADMHARQPERERRREGAALPNVFVTDRSPDTMTLEAQEGRFPPTNISPGSEVALVEQGERDELCRGIVSKISRRRITIEFPAGAPRHRLPPRLTVNLVFDAKVFEAYHSAVLGAQRALASNVTVDDGPDGLLRAALLGESDPPETSRQVLKGGELTDSQRTAVNQVLSGGRVRLIHGPPGTGKTHTLVHLAMALARAGHSVLVTADSNAAVDNLVVGLRRNGSLAVRVGHAVNLRDEAAEAARIDPIEAPPFVRWAAKQGIIVATTNYGAFRYIDPKGGVNPFVFDYVIHDEAGQATAPSSLAAVMRGRRLVLAGDPKQLPPTVVSMDAKEAGLDVTLFERIEALTGRDRTRMLETQFRMREPIVAFSNKRYYEGRIQTSPDAAAQAGLPDLPASAFQHVTGRENERQRNGSISNDFEVECVADLVARFTPTCREQGWTMAVLTPYQAQREQLRRRLPDVEVSTVDGAQGREWDVVLYSTVRSNPQHRLGFVEDERRLNVAVTRARRNFMLVGDERTLVDNPAFRDLLAVTEKVRLHYPQRDAHGRDQRGVGSPRTERPRETFRPQRDDEGGRRRRRRRRGGGGDRDGRDGRDEGGRDRPADERPREGAQRQAPPASGGPAPPRAPHPGPRYGPPRIEPRVDIPMPELPDAPRPPRRSFTIEGPSASASRAPEASAGAGTPPSGSEREVSAAGSEPARVVAEPSPPSSPSKPSKPARSSKPVKPVPVKPTAKPAAAPAVAPAPSAGKPAAKAAKKVAAPAVAKATAKKVRQATLPATAAPVGDAPCAAKTQTGTACRNKAKPGSRFCGRHQP